MDMILQENCGERCSIVEAGIPVKKYRERTDRKLAET
jgi:hypothetical protein